MQKVTTFLMFRQDAEAAAKLYTSLIPNSRIVSATPASVTFELDGQTFYAFNGGPHFTFSEGISLFITCQTQAEVDALWDKLSAGGKQKQCGWVEDRFGVSWQIVPSALMRLMGDRDPAKAARVTKAMLGMKKLDIAGLQRAYDAAA